MISYYRGTIAIYASATYNKARFVNADASREDCEFGSIIGFVDIVDCIIEEEVTNKTKDWFHGPYGYVFENVRILKDPIEVKPPKGAIVWWTLEGQLAQDCLEQISMDSYKPVAKIKADPNKPKIKNQKKRGELVPSIAISSILGIEPMTQKNADRIFVEYLETNDLVVESEKNGKKVYMITVDAKIGKLTDEKNISSEDLFKLISDNLEVCDKDAEVLTPSELLEPLVGQKPLTLKEAIKKFMKYMDKHELYEYEDEDDEIGCIMSDDNIRKLINKEKVQFEEFGAILRENFKS